MVDMEGMSGQECELVEEYTRWLYAKLAELRRPFPPENIEKLPKPMWRGAWDGERAGRCSECGGYHVLANAIHLDYVGHAQVTHRLLEIDPCWDWEPMAYTPEGLPLFVKDGLWIKLTILGVTRIGFGDGNSIKEVIGDAIRNAAMRFGVALDLWSKADLHTERNPGDGPTRNTRATQPRGAGRQDRAVHHGQPPATEPAPNQEALDELGSICDRHGYDRRSCGPMFAEWAEQQEHTVTPRLIDADSDDIRLFGASLVAMATLGPSDDGRDSAVSDPSAPVGGDTGNRDAAEPATDEAQADPEGMF